MKVYVKCGLVLLVVAGLLAGCGNKEARTVTPADNPNEVIIYVDDTPIYWGQLQHEIRRNAANLPADLPQDQRDALAQRLVTQAIDLLMTRVLVENELKRTGVVVPREELENAKEMLIAGMSGEGAANSLALLLARSGMTMENLEYNLRLDVFKNMQVKDQLDAAVAELTDEKLLELYDENPQQFVQPAGRMVSHILLQLPADADEAAKQEAYARAEAIRQRLLGGESFAGVALEESESPSRERGGDAGLITPGTEYPTVDEAIFSQPVGEIGEVVESPQGLHIILVREEKGEEKIPFENVKDHLYSLIKRQMQDQITRQYYAGLREKADVRFVGRLAPATGTPAPAAAEVTDAEAPPAEEAAAEEAPAAAE